MHTQGVGKTMPSRNTIKQLDTVKTRKEFLPSLVVVTVQVAWIIMVIQFPWLSCKKDYPKILFHGLQGLFSRYHMYRMSQYGLNARTAKIIKLVDPKKGSSEKMVRRLAVPTQRMIQSRQDLGMRIERRQRPPSRSLWVAQLHICAFSGRMRSMHSEYSF